MGARTLLPALLGLTFAAALDVAAQPLGTYRWQLQPFCNVVNVNVVQTGAVYTLDGWDDQCQSLFPGMRRAPLVGVATSNPDGSIALSLNLVTSPGGAGLQVSATVTLPSVSGAWRDSAGYEGTFVFTPGAATPGAPRPDTHVSPAGAIGNNTRVGNGALASLTDGSGNTATGKDALRGTTTGNDNTAVGSRAMFNNWTGFWNTALGSVALVGNVSGVNNTAVGYGSGSGLTSGNNNVYIQSSASLADESNTLRIGSLIDRTFVDGIRGTTTGLDDAVPVVIDSNGQLGIISSSRRGKTNIEDLGTSSRGIFALRPVRFTYRQPFADGSTPVQYGLIAEEVAEVMPELVARGRDGKVEAVKYHVLPALLVAEVQRLERERATLAQELAELRAAVNELRASLSQR